MVHLRSLQHGLTMSQQRPPQLKNQLRHRHIQLIALGGSIGTGLFLGISQSIALAGPSVLLGYAIAGFIAFLMMRQLGEMVVAEPVSGSFSYFAFKYWSPFAGFMSGWNYWVLNILVCMAELSAVGLYVQFWWPEIPSWFSALAFFILINAINLIHVKVFGEAEFFLSLIKIIAIVAMIAFGAYLLASGSAGDQASIANLWALDGFFPHGWMGLVMAMAVIMFSFGGIELIGIAAAETENPQRTIPKAINQIVYRILLFYIGTIFILLSLYPWNQIAQGGSPFVLIFDSLGHVGVATALNFIVLTAAISVYNGTSYGTSRMLLGLAEQGNAPRYLKKINQRGVPYTAILTSALVTAICVILNFIFPEDAFKILMSLVISAIVINWTMLSLTHLKFKNQIQKQSTPSLFPSIAYPWSNYLCVVFMLGILWVMWNSTGMRIAVILIPFWLGCLILAYYIKQKLQKPSAS